MIWGIIGAMDSEVALLRDRMEISQEREVFGAPFYIGQLEGRDCVLSRAGIGTVNAALCASVMIREFGAGCVINIGVGGGMAPGLRTLDLCLSTKALYHDRDKDAIESSYPFTIEFDADPKLLSCARRACAQMGEEAPRVFEGVIATGDQFVTDSAEKELIAGKCSPLCVDMEGAAIAQAAFMNGVPFLVIRAVSDTADDDAEMSFYEFKERAANRSAAVILGMLRLS